MTDRGKVISAYECVITRGKTVCECGKCDYHINDSAVFFCDNQRVLTDALALLKEQKEQIDTLKENFAHLSAMIAVQQEIVRCKDCKHSCDYTDIFPDRAYKCIKNGGFHNDNWFCADGERKSTDEILMEEMDADPLG